MFRLLAPAIATPLRSHWRVSVGLPLHTPVAHESSLPSSTGVPVKRGERPPAPVASWLTRALQAGSC